MNKFFINGLKQAEKKDLEQCANIAALAFLDDPSSIFLFKNELCYKSLFDFYLILYKSIFNKMNIYINEDNFSGFIITSSIKKSIITIADFIKNGGNKIIYKHGLGLVKRSLSFEHNNILIRKNFINTNDWYIMQFGVNPSKQKCGIGSKLMKPLINWFDENYINCYLETFKDVNIKIYNHYGFELKYTGFIPDKSRKQYAMLRKYSQVK